jgi:MFS family permease
MSEKEVGEKTEGKPGKWVLGTLTFSHLSQHFYVGAPILYSNAMMALGIDYAQIGVITGASNILGGILQMAYSIAARRYSRRVLLGVSNLIMSLGCFVMGVANGFLAFLGGNATAGLGQAGMHPMGTSIIAEKFGRKGVAGALSTFYGLGYIGNIISPILLTLVAGLMGTNGWRFSFIILAVVPFVTGITVILYLRGEPAGRKIELEGERDNLWNSIKSSLRTPGALFILAAQSFITAGTGLGVITTWIPLYLREVATEGGLGIDPIQAGIISAISTAGGVVGTIAVGHLADRFGHLRTAIACTVGTVVMVYPMTFYSSFTPILIPHLFALGVTCFSITSLLQAHLSIVSSPSQRDTLLGLFFTVGFGISSIWTTLMGFLIDEYRSFNPVWIMMATLGIVAIAMLFGAYRTMPKKEQAIQVAEG